MIEKLQAQIEELTRQLAEAKTQFSTEVQARASLQGNLQDVTKAKDEENDKITKQLTDERDRHANQETTDKGRIDDLDKRLKDADARVKAANDDRDKQVAKLAEDVKVREGRIAELSKRVEMIRQPDTPDGSVSTPAQPAPTSTSALADARARHAVQMFNYAERLDAREGLIEVTKVEARWRRRPSST